MPPSNTVDEDPEQAVSGFSDAPSAADYRERLERARREARRRYLDHLRAVFTRYSVADPGELAGVAVKSSDVVYDVVV